MLSKILPIGLLLWVALSPVAASAQAAPVFKSVTVDLPAGDRVFPGGAAAEAINNNKRAMGCRGHQDAHGLQGTDRPQGRQRDPRLSGQPQGREMS